MNHRLFVFVLTPILLAACTSAPVALFILKIAVQ